VRGGGRGKDGEMERGGKDKGGRKGGMDGEKGVEPTSTFRLEYSRPR